MCTRNRIDGTCRDSDYAVDGRTIKGHERLVIVKRYVRERIAGD